MKLTGEKNRKKNRRKETRTETEKKRNRKFFPLSHAIFFHLRSQHLLSIGLSSLLLFAQHVGDLLALGLAARVRAELLLREPERALLASRLEQLADAALVGSEAGDLADDLADDLDALGAALLRELAEGGVRRRRR